MGQRACNNPYNFCWFYKLVLVRTNNLKSFRIHNVKYWYFLKMFLKMFRTREFDQDYIDLQYLFILWKPPLFIQNKELSSSHCHVKITSSSLICIYHLLTYVNTYWLFSVTPSGASAPVLFSRVQITSKATKTTYEPLIGARDTCRPKHLIYGQLTSNNFGSR